MLKENMEVSAKEGNTTDNVTLSVMESEVGGLAHANSGICNLNENLLMSRTLCISGRELEKISLAEAQVCKAGERKGWRGGQGGDADTGERGSAPPAGSCHRRGRGRPLFESSLHTVLASHTSDLYDSVQRQPTDANICGQVISNPMDSCTFKK